MPWRLLAKRWPAPAELRTVTVAALRAVREQVFTRPAGVVLAGLGLLHLLRDTPGFAELAYRRAGGLAGMAVGGPLAWACSVFSDCWRWASLRWGYTELWRIPSISGGAKSECVWR